MDEVCRLPLPDGVTLSYRRWRAPVNPERRTLVLLHGLASNHTRWAEFAEQTALKLNWNILRPDLRGHGESPARGKTGLETWCDDLLRLLDAENVDRAMIAGHSLGAQVACLFAARHPARVMGLVLVDPTHRPALRGWLKLARRLAPLLRLVANLIRLLNRLGLRRRSFPSRDLRTLDEATRAALAASGNPREIVHRYTAPWEDLRYFPLANYLQELIEVTRPLPPPATVRAPVLVLLSSGVTFTDAAMMRAWASDFPSARTQTIEAYHWPLTERPVEVRLAIERFCEGLAPQRA
ncbi:MAG: alpha/beta hydrolase [Gammaproteobacteria bacterium]|nr:alpha/beta hydrolase [Gammaproteobacteria bacterium]